MALSQGIKPTQDTSLLSFGPPSFVQTSDNVIQSVVNILKNQGALELFDGGTIFFGGSMRSVNFEDLAHWLLSQTILFSPQEAVNRLERFLQLEAIPILRVLGICGVNLKGEIQLDDDIKLVPFSKVPNSATKEWIVNPQKSWFFRSPNQAIPTAALTVSIPVKPKMANSFLGRLIQDLEIQKNNQLHEMLHCLTLVGPSAPVPICVYDHVPEWIPFASQLQGMGSYFHEIDPVSDSILPTIDSTEAASIVKSYLELSRSTRDKLRLPIERLNLAMRRRNDADSAIELGIALEALLVHDRDGNTPLSFLICLRGSLLLGGTSSERQDNYNLLNAVYALRNKAAHTGNVDETSKIGKGDNKKSLQTNYLIQDGIELCANLIKRIIQRGCFPDWQSLILNIE